MGTAPGSFIPDVFEEHLDAIGFLWAQRRSALRSPDYTVLDLLDLEEGVEAHLDGVQAAGEASMPILESELPAEDPLRVFAAAYTLLYFRTPSATARVLEAFRVAEADRLAGLEEALSHGPLDGALAKVEELRRNGPPPVALAAATALTFHSTIPPPADEVRPFLRHDDPAVRRRSWRLIGYLGASVEPKTYAAAMRDGDAGVRRAALYAGAWCGEPGVLTVCRKLATEPTPENLDALELLAILAGPDDLPLLATLATNEALGPARFRLAGTYGHPGLMDLVLAGIGSADPATAAAAASAFTKLTGQSVDSDQRAALPPEGSGEPDEFEAEFQEEVTLPDPELSRRHWELVKPQLQRASRLQRGFDVGRGLTPEEFAMLDMESRWEMWLRARFQGTWRGSPLGLERFPQPRSPG